MRLESRNPHGEVKGVWVAKTKRGFSQKQLAEQEAVREAMERKALRSETEDEQRAVLWATGIDPDEPVPTVKARVPHFLSDAENRGGK